MITVSYCSDSHEQTANMIVHVKGLKLTASGVSMMLTGPFFRVSDLTGPKHDHALASVNYGQLTVVGCILIQGLAGFWLYCRQT